MHPSWCVSICLSVYAVCALLSTVVPFLCPPVTPSQELTIELCVPNTINETPQRRYQKDDKRGWLATPHAEEEDQAKVQDSSSSDKKQTAKELGNPTAEE